MRNDIEGRRHGAEDTSTASRPAPLAPFARVWQCPAMSIPASLTEEEVRIRAQALAVHSTFDGDGILGFLHA